MNIDLLFSSKKNTWETPHAFFEKYDRIFQFTTDVCALPENTKCQHFFTPDTDGLKQEWKGACWMNPPYGRQATGKWIEKAFYESRKKGTIVVALVPARTDTRWFHEYVYKRENDGITYEFIKGRIKFVGANAGAPFPSLLVVFKPGNLSE